jgi:hypothetical protein
LTTTCSEGTVFETVTTFSQLTWTWAFSGSGFEAVSFLEHEVTIINAHIKDRAKK